MKCRHARQNLPGNIFEFLGVKSDADRRSVLQVFIDNYQDVTNAIHKKDLRHSNSTTVGCMVCLCDVNLAHGHQQCDNSLTVLPCKHMFHRKCVFQWLLFQTHCPVCRIRVCPKGVTNHCRSKRHAVQWWLSDFDGDLLHPPIMMASNALDPAAQQLLSKHEFLELVESGEGDDKRARVKCSLTQHEMLPRMDVIETHLKSKKFVKARDWYCHDYAQYEPYIVPHRRLTKSLFCNVTGTILNRIPSEVEKHVQGKRYKRLKQHVKIKVRKSDDDKDEEEDNGEFNADAFEFANSQVIYSSEEEEEEEGDEEEDEELQDVKPKKGKKKQQKEEEEDDMADLYPDDESDEEEKKDNDGDETVKEKPQKKRPAKDNSTTKKTRHKTKKVKKAD
ncbi:hypothetical protein PF003_g31240 [Phytophthora fragariae]|nr:hypothetical protein PF003_g31240 [Phytophthora fragariae]